MTTLGIVMGNRGFFPSELCEEGRAGIIKVIEEEGFGWVALPTDATSYGSVETWEDAKKCAALFKEHRDEIDGILVTLPNFGDERGIADTIRLAGLNVPVLVQAYPDSIDKMSIAHRRDSFCGKMSACNNMMQYGIDYSLTTLHTVDPDSDSFRQDLQWFGAVCRVVNGLRGARFGMMGARPANFITVRHSERILERAGISVETLDLSEVFGRAARIADNNPKVGKRVQAIKDYVTTGKVNDDMLVKMAKLAMVTDDWIAEHELDGTAFQCWTAMEEFYGVVPCTVMSMLGNKLIPSACETDITGLIGMYAMVLASGRPSALLDWNNNYGDDPNKGVVFHCSNLPQDFFGGQAEMDYQAIIAGTVGKDNTYGTLNGPILPTDITYCRVSTDDYNGRIRAYMGEAQITNDPVQTFGGYGVIEMPKFQKLLRYICEQGFEHHVAINPTKVASAIYEATTKYLDWDVYLHEG